MGCSSGNVNEKENSLQGNFDFIPVSLLSPIGKLDSSILKGKINSGYIKLIAFYFSAHWCPPCRKFTSILKNAYDIWNRDEKIIEIVFVSSDKTRDEFIEYFKSMPWLAIDFDEITIKKKLLTTYRVTGIPRFVILNQNAKLLRIDARKAVTDNVSGCIYDWLKG